MTIETTIHALIHTKKKIKEYQKTINELRKQEREYVKEIQSCLNERREQGIRVDDNTYIELSSHEKKINLSTKDHEQHVRHMLFSRGIDDEAFTKQLLNKTRDIVQEQKIKIKEK